MTEDVSRARNLNRGSVQDKKQHLSVHSVAQLAVKVGVIMLANGAAAAEVVQAMLEIAQKAGMSNINVDVNYTAIVFSFRPGDEESDRTPYVRIETIKGRTFDYGKLTDVSHLVERFSRNELTITEAQAAVQKIETSRGPYPVWLTRLAGECQYFGVNEFVSNHN